MPIPKILEWSDDPSNAIGSEYIIMEHAVGVQLHQKWPMMSGVQQIDCIQAISRNIQQIAAINFPAYGSLYFADAPLDPISKVPLTQAYSIGPHCGTRYWDCSAGDTRYYHSTKPNRGPCELLSPFDRSRVADWSTQGLISPHTPMASLILGFLGCLLMKLPSAINRPFKDLLERTLAC